MKRVTIPETHIIQGGYKMSSKVKCIYCSKKSEGKIGVCEVCEQKLKDGICPECDTELGVARMEAESYGLSKFITICRGCGATYSS